jgi:hypothetical protein
LNEADIAAHRTFVETLGPEALWIKIERPEAAE